MERKLVSGIKCGVRLRRIKYKTLYTLYFIFCTLYFTYAQKGKINEAINYYKEPLQQYDKAKEAIDAAVENEQTKTSDKAWYYRALIYHSLYKNEKYGTLCNKCLETAYESFAKALELNPKNEW